VVGISARIVRPFLPRNDPKRPEKPFLSLFSLSSASASCATRVKNKEKSDLSNVFRPFRGKKERTLRALIPTSPFVIPSEARDLLLMNVICVM
jgi:hypothetical protein